MSLKIVFAGTPLFALATLKRLTDSEHSVVAVYTQPDRPAGRGQTLQSSPIKEFAVQHHIPVYQPTSLKGLAEQDALQKLQADVMVVVAYGLILPPKVLTIPQYGCINVHASLLPRWRGAAPIQHAILSGDAVTGVSIMQMDVGLDTGDALQMVTCPINPKDTSQTLYDKLSNLGAEALINTLKNVALQKLNPIKQTDNDTTYAAKISKTDAEIHWEESAVILDRKIRAFNPWPVCFTTLQQQTVRIWSASPIESSTIETPGTIVRLHPNAIDVATGQGILQLQEIQLAGGKKLPVQEILKSKSALFQVGMLFR